MLRERSFLVVIKLVFILPTNILRISIWS